MKFLSVVARRRSLFSTKKLALYLLSLTIPFSLENGADILHLGPAHPDQGLLSPVFLYQWIVTAGPRKPRAHFVRVLLIDKKTEPDDLTSETSPCAQRDFIAQLLRTVATAGPAVIVIDKFYPRDNCSESQSAALVASMKDVSKRIPVVVAALDDSAEERPNADVAKLRVLSKKGAVILSDSLDFGPDVKRGLKTLNADERKIPLSWPVIKAADFDALPASELALRTLALQETLSIVAVREYDPGTLGQQTFAWFAERRVDPFTSFLKPSQIPTDAPIDLICDHENSREFDWRRRCLVANPSSIRLKEFRNRVVIIGQNHSQDVHYGVIGAVPGVVLQANYIESLLDDRYLKPSPLWIQLVISISWLALIEWIFTRYESRPHFALAASVLAIAGLWLLTYDVAVLQLGRYLVLWPPSAIAMIGRYAMLVVKPRSASPQ